MKQLEINQEQLTELAEMIAQRTLRLLLQTLAASLRSVTGVAGTERKEPTCRDLERKAFQFMDQNNMESDGDSFSDEEAFAALNRLRQKERQKKPSGNC